MGIPVTKPTDLFGDNFGVIQSAEIPEGELKKKHIAISYHYMREAIASQIVNAIGIRSAENFAGNKEGFRSRRCFRKCVTSICSHRKLGMLGWS
jgi:hypothetical protein